MSSNAGQGWLTRQFALFHSSHSRMRFETAHHTTHFVTDSRLHVGRSHCHTPYVVWRQFAICLVRFAPVHPQKTAKYAIQTPMTTTSNIFKHSKPYLFQTIHRKHLTTKTWTSTLQILFFGKLDCEIVVWAVMVCLFLACLHDVLL